MVNQGLLKTLTECEYPTEFLVARLLGKKSTLLRNWEFLIASNDRLQSLQNTPFYPYLKKYGWTGLCKTDEDEHNKITVCIDNLVALITSLGTLKSEDFNKYLQKVVHHFVPLVQEHLAYEEELFWPIALIAVDDIEIWETIKAAADEFEY